MARIRRRHFLKVPIYRIVSIASLNAKREDGGGPWTVAQIGSRSVGEKTEAEVLLGFVKALPVDGRGTGPILVTFGGNGFDLPPYVAIYLGVFQVEWKLETPRFWAMSCLAS